MSRIIDTSADRFPVEIREKVEVFLSELDKIVDINKDAIDTTDFMNLLDVLPFMLKLQALKGIGYGRSYCEHGEVGIYLGTIKKVDRLKNVMKKAMAKGTKILYEGDRVEEFIDTIIDGAIYFDLWVGWTKEHHPEVWQAFLERSKLID